MSDLSRLELVIDSKGVVTANGNLDLFKKKSDEAAKAATSVGNTNRNSAKSFDILSAATSLQAIAYGAASLGIVKFMDSCAEASGRMEMLKTNLQVVTGSAEDADKMFRQLQKFAAETPFSMEGITDTATQLLQVGVGIDDVIGQLQMLGDVSGGSQEKLNRIMTNYTQILSVGKASTMDIRQFAQANLPIYAELEKVTGKTGEALQDMITNGEITGDVITKAFRDMTMEGGKFYNGMNLAAETYEGKLSTMKDSLTNLSVAFADLWYIKVKKAGIEAITSVSDAFARFLTEIKDNKDSFDVFNNDYANATFSQKEYVANQQIEFYRKKVQVEKGQGGIGTLNEGEYQDALDNLNSWYDYLDKITKEEAELEKAARAEADALIANASSTEQAAAKKAKWQEVMKSALDLDEVNTGSQAVADFQENIETSLNGALAYAQMTGGNISDVYLEYAEKVQKAIKELLLSGLWKPDEKTITDLNSFGKEIGSIGNAAIRPMDSYVHNGMGDGSNAKPAGLTDDSVAEQEELANRLADIYKSLGEQLVQFTADATFDALWDMGAALYEGENAAKAFGASLLKSIINNVPAMLFQTGFQMAITGNVYGGLALMAASGLGAVAGGYLNSLMNDDSSQSEADKLQEIADQLEGLIDQAKADAQYYQDQLRTLKAQYSNSLVTESVSVNDAIIAPGGKIISTAPDDYLIATKTPGSLSSESKSNVYITVSNTAGEVVTATATSKQNADGTTQIMVAVEKILQSGISSGKYDNAFAAREARISGRRVSS